MSGRRCQHFETGRSKTRGAALVITLAFVVLITFVSVATLARITLNQQIESGSTAQGRTDVLARGATEAVIADLRQEMLAGSDPNTTSPVKGFFAMSPSSPAKYLPARVLKTTAMESDQKFQALLKQSKQGVPAFTSSGGFSSHLVGAASNSSTPSPNGRFVSMTRWNKPRLLRGGAVVGEFDSSEQTPDWILIDRRGTVENAQALNASMINSALENGEFVTGRFAYNIYDVSGLLNANAVAYPTTGFGAVDATSLQSIKDTMAGVVIDGMPGVIDAGAFVQWRNARSLASFPAEASSRYVDFIRDFARPNGFVKPWISGGHESDSAFVSRQDLIAYTTSGQPGLSELALPFLSTFGREKNAPSWIPQNPSAGNAPANYRYGDLADSVTAVNRRIAAVRVKVPFTRSNGSEATVGEPLLKTRFSLSRLKAFSDPANNSENIQKFFCMRQRADSLWDYVDPDSGAVSATLPTIKNLEEIAAAGREPTFWEMLRAAILSGSVGVGHGRPSGYDTTSDLNADRQIFEIGLNIIDQYDADDTPTVLRFGGTQPSDLKDMLCAGTENIPGLLWITPQHFWDTITAAPEPGKRYIVSYLQFAMWNPHRNPSSAPGKYRIYSTRGRTRIYAVKAGTAESAGGVSVFPHTLANSCLTFQTTANRTFSNFDVIMPSDIVSAETTSYARFPIGAGSPMQVGLITGRGTMRTDPAFPETGNNLNVDYIEPMNLVLEKEIDGKWIPYSVMPNFKAAMNNNGQNFSAVYPRLNAGIFAAALHFSKCDPRTTRFGLGGRGRFLLASTFNSTFYTGGTYAGLAAGSGTLPFNSNITTTRIDLTPSNNPAAASSYADADAQKRGGDSLPTDTSPLAGAANRPVILNRPFLSVGEMGYAFRADPWKTLDFQSETSADGALLDFFCLEPSEAETRAGIVNVNTAPPEVLAAVLRGAYLDPLNMGSSSISAEAAAVQAAGIRDYLSAHANRLVTNVADIPRLAGAVSASSGTNKPAREALSRTLAGMQNSRTWNLLIDLVVQSGRYPATANSLDSFLVEGEKRFWVHVAVDRITGEIVDIQTEPVLE